LNVVDQKLVIKEIGMFVMELVVNLQDVKAKQDNTNKPLDSNVPLVLSTQLVKFLTDVFIREVLDPFYIHISKF
jgi:hypothetical protein